eukprot:7319380-Alexandrium_andersonii.AAC.1
MGSGRCTTSSRKPRSGPTTTSRICALAGSARPLIRGVCFQELPNALQQGLDRTQPVSYTHLRAHETSAHL